MRARHGEFPGSGERILDLEVSCPIECRTGFSAPLCEAGRTCSLFFHGLGSTRILSPLTDFVVSQPNQIPPGSCAPHYIVTSAEQSRWFAEEIHAHDSQLKSYLRKSFPNVRDVDDVMQESYLRIWKARATHPVHYAKAFLFRVARHVALDRVRHEHRSPIDPIRDLSTLGAPDEGGAWASGVERKIELLSDAIAALPERRREIVILRKLKRLSQKETALQLGVSERTVENQLLRGIKQCRHYLQSRGIANLFDDEK